MPNITHTYYRGPLPICTGNISQFRNVLGTVKIKNCVITVPLNLALPARTVRYKEMNNIRIFKLLNMGYFRNFLHLRFRFQTF
jgi:hypothetical protein